MAVLRDGSNNGRSFSLVISFLLRVGSAGANGDGIRGVASMLKVIM